MIAWLQSGSACCCLVVFNYRGRVETAGVSFRNYPGGVRIELGHFDFLSDKNLVGSVDPVRQNCWRNPEIFMAWVWVKAKLLGSMDLIIFGDT